MNDIKSTLQCHNYVGEIFSNSSYTSPGLILPVNGLIPESAGLGWIIVYPIFLYLASVSEIPETIYNTPPRVSYKPPELKTCGR